MRKIIIFLILICTSKLYGANFETQKDSYFGRVRTKIIWSIASGLSTGSANGFLGLRDGFAGDAELLRFVGRIKPEHRIFEYIWMSLGFGYNLYEDDNNMYEVLTDQVCMGVGLKISDKGFWRNITPYIGGGAGYGAVFHRTGINSDDPEVTVNDGVVYLQTGGMEFKLFNTITLFVEEKYIWGTILDKRNYIPLEYEHDDWQENVPLEKSFARKEIDMHQFTIKAGIRFYWGQNMFWFFPFFWEK